MTETQPKNFIETLFPTDLLNLQVTREKGGNAFKGVHRWYSRKPLSFSRASVLGAILPDTVSMVEFLTLLGLKPQEAEMYWNHRKGFLENHKNSTRLFDQTPTSVTKEKIQSHIQKHWGKENLTVLDPFSGGGSIPFEALRLGLNVIANDLNPVAVTTMKAAIEFPFIFGPELQKDIDHYVQWIGTAAEKRLAEFFSAPEGEEVQNYFWAHTVPCEYCETVVPLSPNWFIYCRAEKQNLHKWCAVKPVPLPEQKQVTFELIRGRAGKGKIIELANGELFDPAAFNTIASGVGTCPACQRPISRERILSHASEHGLGHQMYAVAYRSGKGGLKFRLPTEEEYSVSQVAAGLDRLAYLVPNSEVPYNNQTAEHGLSSPIPMGMKTWDKWFNPRQLLTLTTYLELIQEAIAAMREQGMEEDRIEALATYLTLILDQCVDFNSRLSRWDSATSSGKACSATHALNLNWNYPEFNGATTLWSWRAETAANNYILLAKWFVEQNGAITLLQESASALFDLSDGQIDVIVTDPPYYDTIPYADLSDFFYVWQKKALEPLYLPRLQTDLTNKDEEAVASPHRFRDTKSPKQAAKADYEAKMQAAFAECHRVLQDKGIMIIQFNHKDSGAWDSLSQALMEAGFCITATWSVNTESPESLHQADKNSVASTIALACRKRLHQEEGWWTEVERKVRQRVEAKVSQLEDWGMQGVDLLLGCFGPALEVFSSEYPVLHQDGNPVRPEEIFQVTRQTLIRHLFRKYTHEHELLLDKETQFYLVVWALLQAQSFDFDEARQIAMAVGVEIKDLERRHLVKKDGGSLVFLTPEQRLKKRAFSLDGDLFISQVDMLHLLFCVAEAQGSQGIAALVQRLEWSNDERMLQLLEVAYQVLPQTDKHPMKKQMQEFILWVEPWNRFFNDQGIWQKDVIEEDRSLNFFDDLGV